MSRDVAPNMLMAMLEHSQEMMLMVDPSSLDILACTRYAARHLGYQEAELLALKITDIECSIQDLFFWDSLQFEIPERLEGVEGMHRRHNGDVFPVLRHLQKIQLDGQTLVLLTAQDISDTKQVKDELAQYSSQLGAALEATADGILVLDLHGGIINMNRQFALLWPLPEHLLNEHNDALLLAFMHSQMRDPAQYQATLDTLLQDPVAEGLHQLELADGRIFERSARPMWLDNVPVGRVYSFNDITERMVADRQLRQAKEKAERANRAKSEFLSQMSHELRTPLNAILGFGQILEGETSGEQLEQVRYIMRAGWHLLDLINEVLDMAKIEAGKLSLSIEPVSVSELVAECQELVRPMLAKNNIELQIDLPPTPVTVQADRVRLKQMLLNLASNAIKYNRPQGRVRIHGYTQGKQWRLCVADTGIGMSEEDLSQLFQPFSRVGNKQHNIEGTGIGLAFTRKLAQLMQGDVGVSSEIGQGSVFWIDLPLVETQAPQIAAASAQTGASAPVPQAEQQRLVLYVEDDPVSTLLMKSIFKQFPQARLLTAPEPFAGLELALTHRPDFILLDINMPGMTGIELVKKLREAPETCNVLIYALSANALPADVERGMQAGFDRYLTKPVNVRDLKALVSELLALPVFPQRGYNAGTEAEPSPSSG